MRWLLVLCASAERWDKTKVQPKPPFLILPHAQLVSVCATIVDAISVLPMPYAVDYPVFMKLRVPEQSLQALFGLPVWNARDVSSPFQQEHGVLSITCTPPAEVIAELERRLGWACAPIAIAKIRLYVRKHTEGQPFWQCSALPIVTFETLTDDALNRVWQLLRSNSGYGDEESWELFTTPTSKLRLVQYIAASSLANIWLEGIARQVVSRPVLGQSHRILECLFSPPALGLVQRLVESTNRLFKTAPFTQQHLEPPDLELQPASTTLRRDIASVRTLLCQPFIDLERTAERTAQESGRAIPPEQWEVIRNQAPYNRLHRGFSHNQLEQHVKHLGDDAKEAASLFLDQAIDRGIVVPITTARNGFVYRAYRYGEDVLFSKSEIRLCGLALQACSASSSRPVLPRTLVEKLLVILLRVGVQQRFLNPFLGVPGSPGTVGIRFSLHGAVAQAGVAELYGHDEERWLSHLLEDHGVVRENALADGTGTGFQVSSSLVEASVYANSENRAKQIGMLVGHLHRSAEPGRRAATVSLDEWTLVATCINEVEVVSALAAEIDIFVRGWRRACSRIQSDFQGPAEKETSTDLCPWLKQQRFWIAINSAKWKFEKHCGGVPRHLVYHEIPNRIQDPLYKTVWTSFWPEENDPSHQGRDSQVVELLRRQAQWVYETNIYARLLLLAMAKPLQNAPASLPADGYSAFSFEVLNDIGAIAKAYQLSCPNSIGANITRDIELARQRSSSSTFDRKKMCDYVVNRLDALVETGKCLLAEAAIKVGHFGRILGMTRFSHVLHIDICAPAATHRSLFDRASKIIHSAVSKAQEQNRGPVAVIPRSECSVLRGLWVCGDGLNARRLLIQAATDVIASTGRHVPVRAVLFCELPRSLQIMRAESENRYFNPAFWDRASFLIDRQWGLPEKNELHIITTQEYLESIRAEVESTQVSLRSVPPPAGRASYARTKTAKANRLLLDGATGEGFSHLNFPFNLATNRTMQNGKESGQWHYDVGILTMIPPEVKAVLGYLSPDKPIDPKRAASSGRVYYRTDMLAAKNTTLRAVVTQTLSQGSRSIVSAYTDLVTDFHPRWVVLLGIVGSIHKDAQLTDVVIAEQSIYYDKRAETEEGPKHRGETYLIEPIVKSVVNAILVANSVFEASAGSFSETFNLHLGPIGTGEAVVKFRDAEVRQWLTQFNDKTLALETEAGGLGQAFYETKLNPNRGPQGTVIIRGVSDHADHAKDDKWQLPASQNCCVVLGQFLSTLINFKLIG